VHVVDCPVGRLPGRQCDAAVVSVDHGGRRGRLVGCTGAKSELRVPLLILVAAVSVFCSRNDGQATAGEQRKRASSKVRVDTKHAGGHGAGWVMARKGLGEGGVGGFGDRVFGGMGFVAVQHGVHVQCSRLAQHSEKRQYAACIKTHAKDDQRKTCWLVVLCCELTVRARCKVRGWLPRDRCCGCSQMESVWWRDQERRRVAEAGPNSTHSGSSGQMKCTRQR